MLPKNKLFACDCFTSNQEDISRSITRGVCWTHSDIPVVVFYKLLSEMKISLPKATFEQFSIALHLDHYGHCHFLYRRYLQQLYVHAVLNAGIICYHIWDISAGSTKWEQTWIEM